MQIKKYSILLIHFPLVNKNIFFLSYITTNKLYFIKNKTNVVFNA